MKENLNISIIIAVYQRTDELRELLQSLIKQIDSDFEVVVVDDGSPEKLLSVTEEFNSKLNIQYFYKENSGAGKSRNYGMESAHGNYFIFLDSDTIAPENYIQSIRKELKENYVDAFGGPDAADENFSDLQKAISFSMTSFLTTGGIRGGKKHIGKFQPRSFNMGISKEAFVKTGGFGELRIGEDPDLSMILWENGFETRLFPESKVYHKRRTSLKKFAKQVYQFGVARPILNQRHPNYTKLTFWFPSLFLIYFSFCLLSFIASFFRNEIMKINLGSIWINLNYFQISTLFSIPFVFYLLMIFFYSSIQNKSIKVGFFSIITTLIQFSFYGYGFLQSWLVTNLLKQKPDKIFPSHFHKNSL
ncbi:glycosyltransferase [Moheibacter sediminis]|uniref:Glycosyltransferase, GT2 family n=1 Tax=Moheibacter sediminis TaxID=1434700 RepID=A0A1W2C5I7_9FLAO|nr:glycosyltransferase [Moheibacter sediminis]SMC80142.1 Glycosyltransferase, GT2 family [Moheibacter sediminis]